MRVLVGLRNGGLGLLGMFLMLALAWAIEDSPEERARQAERYLAAVPPAQMIEDITKGLSATLPANQRDIFRKAVASHLDVLLMTRVMRDGLVKHFTAEELRALADFYGSAVGRAAMNKLGVYTAEVTPALQAEIIRAVSKARSELEGRPRRQTD